MAKQDDRLNKKDLIETIIIVSLAIDLMLAFFISMIIFNRDLFIAYLPFITVIWIVDFVFIIYLFYYRETVHSIEKLWNKKLLRKLKKIKNKVE